MLAVLFIVGWALGTAPVADALLRPLERPYAVATPAAGDGPDTWIIVLAAGALWDPALPPGGWMAGTSLYRVVEGVRLQRELPESTLVLMGGVLRQEADRMPDTYPMVARLVGADPDRLRYEVGARNTHAEARWASAIIPAGDPVYLVSSASHLTRALYLFRGAGLDPIPAPAHANTGRPPGMTRRYGFGSFFPSSGAYRRVDRAAHEYAGIVWAWLRGQGEN